jgi:transposase
VNSSSNSRKPRRVFTGAEKVAILKQHLLDKVPVSELCDQHQLYPNQFYTWLKDFFENGHLAFATERSGRKAKALEDAKQAKIEQLQAKLTRKNEVMAELMEALTEEKKRNGEL